MSGCDQQALCHATEFPDMADEQTIQKDCGTIGIYRQFDLGGDERHLETQIFHHLHENSLLFSGLQSQFACEIFVTVLANGDLMFARKEQDLLRSLEFLQVAKVLAINPDPGGLLDFRCTH